MHEDGYKCVGTGSSWYTILGDTPIPMQGIVLITFEVVNLVQTIEFGFAPRDVSKTTYFGENSSGFSYQISQEGSSNDGLWNGGSNTNYGQRGL